MAVQLESPTLGRGSDWNSFYATEPLEGNPPFSPSSFGLLLFGEPDAESARALLGIPDVVADLTFADIGGTISVDQLPPGSLVSVDDIGEDALYFFDEGTGLPRLIGSGEAASFLGNSLTFANIGGTIGLSQFPPGSVASLDSIDEDALYFFDNALFEPRLLNATGTVSFISGHLAFSDLTGTISSDQLPAGSVATLDPIDEDAFYFYDNDTLTPMLIGKADALAFLLPNQTGQDGNFLQTNAGVLSWAATAGGGTWGSITGTLSSQTDLQAALDAKQPLDSDLTTIAGLTATTDNFMVSVSSAWASRTPTQVRTTLGLTIGTNVQAWDADLDALAALSGTNTIYYRSASNTWSAVTIGSNMTFSGGTLNSTAPGTGDVVGPSSSVDAEIALFNSTTGKLIKRATGSGLVKATSGVYSTITDSSSNWDTAYTDRLKWDGGATGLTAATGRTSLGLGTVATLASDTDGTLAANSDSNIATQKAVKTYIDGINTALLAAIAALDSKDEVAYCSTSALPTCTYANGTLGVGATLTATTNGPLIIDSATIVVGAVGLGVLVAGQASDFQNGWYRITQQGVVAVSPWILTRRTTDDQAAEIGPGYLTAVEAPTGLTAGSANNQKVFLSISPTPFVVGTDSLTFALVGGTYTAGNGLSLSGTAFSINTAITADLSTAQSLTNKKLGSLTSNGFVKTSGGDGTLSVDTATYQPLDTDLTTLAGLTATTDNFIVSVSSAWASRTPSQVRSTLGLVIGTNVQAWDSDLDTWATITPGTGVGTFLATPSSANLISAMTDETGTGSLVFANTPTLVTPVLGAATGTSIVLSSFLNEAKGADIASATTTDIGAATGNYVVVTGTVTITGLGTVQAGTRRNVKFSGALTLTHNATSLILPGGASITTVAGDTAIFISLGSGNWICTNYQPVTWTGTGTQVMATSPTLVTPLLGTPTSGTLTNCTGLPIAGLTASTSTALGVGSIELGHASDTTITRVSAGLIAVEGSNLIRASDLGTNMATFLATPSSANLLAAMTDETGTGACVFATSPTLVTPILGTPTSGTLSNCGAATDSVAGVMSAADHATFTALSGAFATGVAPTVPKGVLWVAQKSGIDLKTNATTDMFTIPTGMSVVILQSTIVPTAVTGGAAVGFNYKIIESSAAVGQTAAGAAASAAPVTTKVWNQGFVGAGNGPITYGAAGNKIQVQITTGFTTSTTVTGTCYAVGFYF